MRIVKAVSLLFIIASWAGAQTASPAFEVASVKPAAPQPAGGGMIIRRQGGPGTPDPGQITYTNVSFNNILTVAFGIRDYQIFGPGWMNTERFDIAAKVPKDTTKEQFQLMLQNLMAERFKMTFHHDSKEMPVYALSVGKNGPKFKESSAEPPSEKPARQGTTIQLSRGRLRFTAHEETIKGLADMLSSSLSRPVRDLTGLSAKYDFVLEFANDESAAMIQPGAELSPDSAPSLFTAIQEQLGLKLEQKKAPVEIVVVDHLEKTPTAN